MALRQKQRQPYAVARARVLHTRRLSPHFTRIAPAGSGMAKIGAPLPLPNLAGSRNWYRD
ncbi:hypothetical protein H7347_05060 [Corynebacterium sp. zg-331]|uniref:hypothetical protein n=1 Tax=unclassified Corynebacterium TaxID=2624378 RepID=UPI00128B2052|nr:MULTISPECIES: hypothetical protein [unclassified Corynebacterium]MBC3185946.1 hypothetical protein [Corynebacterium sp. zg-331]MPV52437.1 hypothetical protein [Corynebacterium sp. zg331]